MSAKRSWSSSMRLKPASAEPRDPMLDNIERSLTRLLVDGHLNVRVAGNRAPAVSDSEDSVEKTLGDLGRQLLERSNINFEEFRKAYLEANPDRRGSS